MDARGGGGTPYVMGDTYVPRFWPPFFTLAGSSTIFLGYFFSSTNSKVIFWGTKTTNFYKNRSFWPQIQFFPRSFWVQFSAASGTPPSVFRPSTPPGHGRLTSCSSHKSPCQCSPCVGLVSDPPACMTRLLLTVSTCSTPVQDIGVSAEGCLWLWVHSHGGMNSPPASWWVQRGWGCWGTWLTPHLAVEKDYN